jgi:hypothetical protein
MTMTRIPSRPEVTFSEPVPAATQLAALPFLSAIEGYLRGESSDIQLRITLHRVMSREDQQYLQQVSDYIGSERGIDRGGGGRMFKVDVGIIGAAYERAAIFRTKHHADDESFYEALRTDMLSQGDTGDPRAQRRSWMAIPFLGPDSKPVLILFADASELNFFSDSNRTKTLVDMCWGFCRLIDALVERPFPTLRNFPFTPGEQVTGGRTLYESVQEQVEGVAVPRFRHMRSFNFEASIA